MNIKQASEQSGVSAPNIRFYEKEGLLTPARRQGNDYRDYTAGNVRTLKLIRMLRMLDVPLPTIKAVLRGEQPLQHTDELEGTDVPGGVIAVVVALSACRCKEPLFFIKADVRGGHAALFGSLFDVHLLHLRPYITP